MMCSFCKGPFHDMEKPCEEMRKAFSRMEELREDRRRYSMEVEQDLPEEYLVKRWKAHGLDCVVLRGEVGLCGYVHVPKDHPDSDKHYDDAGVSVHGGLTFNQKAKGGGMWFGFDTAHFGDWWGFPQTGYEHPGRVWTVEDVAKETEQLAEQFAVHAKETK